MNPWARNVGGGFNWGGPPKVPAADPLKPDDEEDDAPAPNNPQPAPRQKAAARVVQAAPAGPNMFQEHAAIQADMYRATQAAWQRENDSRVRQAREAREQQHEYEMEMLRQQGATARAQPQAAGGGEDQPSNAARQARNRSLLAAAGLGGRTLRYVGGMREVIPHQFGGSPIARSLLG
jgi:hypothetical protein